MGFAIKPNHGTEIPSHHIFFDCETVSHRHSETTDVEELSWRLACATYVRLERGQVVQEKQASFTEPEKLWAFIRSHESPHRPLWIWAHNAHVDLTWSHFWEELEAGRYDIGHVKADRKDPRFKGKKDFFGFACLSGRPLIISALGVNGRVQIVDSCNYLPMSLEAIGQAIGLEKLALPDEGCSDEELFIYCQRDVEILKRAVLDLLARWQREDCGVWQPTAAALAMTNWRHLAPRSDSGRHKYQVIPNRHPTADLLERESYFGGWAECFHYGPVNCKLFKLDVQSCYPAMMAENAFPVYRTHHWTCADPGRFRVLASDGNAIARVLINSGQNTYPVRLRGTLTYARGTFWTTLAGPELAAAIAAGDVEQVRECNVYDLGPIFREWVHYWWIRKLQAKQSSNAMELEFCNLILRALSGKWGQGAERWEDAPMLDSHRDWGEFEKLVSPDELPLQCRAIAGHTQVKVTGETPEWGMPCISAFITSFARLHLKYLISLCPHHSVYHIATDSLIVDGRAFRALQRAGHIRENFLGLLSLKSTADGAEFWGCNQYRFGAEIVAAGSWGAAKEVLDGRWFFDAWDSLSQTLKRRPDGTIRIQRKALENHGGTYKGKLEPNGWTTPYTLDCAAIGDKPLLPGECRWPESWEMPDKTPLSTTK